MFKHYFEQIEGIEVFPVFSLLVFFIFFLLLIVWVVKLRKKYINQMSNLPLENDEVTNTDNSKKKDDEIPE